MFKVQSAAPLQSMDNPWLTDAGIDLGATHHVLALAASLGLVTEEVRCASVGSFKSRICFVPNAARHGCSDTSHNKYRSE